ncbi:GntR family transcriptional regulator [Sphingomonas sp. ASV193]|uniref:GntR family transcriptional regulator n=1 Tax=Sphingomonas sp. ASV193 TaxID=3144405 RepID=UPI0032E8DE65
MVISGGTFERVLIGLRARIEAGVYALGDPLEPAHLAHELAASITPVRDALHRLVGERLVETAPAGGFRFPLMTEVGLRHLYDWRYRLLVMALTDKAKGQASPALTVDADAGTYVRGPDLFAAIARLAANPECGAALANVGARLENVRLREEELLGARSVASEVTTLATWMAASEWGALRRGLRAYHRRRLRIVGDLIATLHRPRESEPSPEIGR